MENKNHAILYRESTRLTVAEFFERYQLKKYNFEPKYQRRGDVWDEDRQAFLIDSILKNYPIPPIFLHQVIDSDTGTTVYNVIDGKQRLTAIIKFINNDLKLPDDYDVGAFGDSRLNAKKFSDLEGDLIDFKKQLWKYVLSIEYIDTSDEDIINNVFDRLNRNGVPLDPQELRRAKYFNTLLIKLVDEVTNLIVWSNLGKVKVNRMKDSEFVSELVFFLLENKALDASEKENLNMLYDKWSTKLNDKKIVNVKEKFSRCIEFINSLNLDFDKYKINGVSHYYALFGLAKHCVDNNISADSISSRVTKFYEALRGPKPLSGNIKEYKESMQSNTRSNGQRTRRIKALTSFCTNTPTKSLPV
ncbi:MAG: hypothetical protein BGN88_11155 [Clostridiales bacterium 43-6]|nr:MAG: hypothetical protein BGN88_11155 [Clostridiales bacterium 43-6]